MREIFNTLLSHYLRLLILFEPGPKTRAQTAASTTPLMRDQTSIRPASLTSPDIAGCINQALRTMMAATAQSTTLMAKIRSALLAVLTIEGFLKTTTLFELHARS